MRKKRELGCITADGNFYYGSNTMGFMRTHLRSEYTQRNANTFIENELHYEAMTQWSTSKNACNSTAHCILVFLTTAPAPDVLISSTNHTASTLVIFIFTALLILDGSTEWLSSLCPSRGTWTGMAGRRQPCQCVPGRAATPAGAQTDEPIEEC